MNDNPLARCPFCRREEATVEYEIDLKYGAHWVQCTHCSASLGYEGGGVDADGIVHHAFDTEAEAMAAWNQWLMS